MYIYTPDMTHCLHIRSRIASCYPAFFRFLCIACLFVQPACKNKSKTDERLSFYHWKTNYRLSKEEVQFLQTRQVEKIYLHCFDVVKKNEDAVPVGVLHWQDTIQKNIRYIPTVFIENKLMLHTDSAAICSLALHVVTLCKQILQTKNLPFDEIQIDCDWTAKTRDHYFSFLSQLRKQNILVSSTLRLYQYKYRQETGIPPVDYVSLMCYNMGNMKNEQAGNSILNVKDLQAYLGEQPPYAKPLNVALPIFGWVLLFRKHRFEGILYAMPDIHNPKWKQISRDHYLCAETYYDSICRQEFYRDDILRNEQISKKQLQQSITLIRQELKNTKNEIIYFDLDSLKIQYCPD